MAMPGWAKALIIVAVLLVLLVIGIIAAGAIWWSKNKDTLIAKGKATIEEGKEAGRTSDNQGCVDKAIGRYKSERGLMSAIGTNIFMQTCLQGSRPTPGFCDQVPSATSFRESATWTTEQCARVDLSGDKFCHQLFQPVQKFCEERGGRTESDEPGDKN
jgi:hypothetical protein